MIAKLITHGENRDSAIENMTNAIDQYVIDGLSHNLNFLSSIMQNKTFRSGIRPQILSNKSTQMDSKERPSMRRI